MLLKNNQTPERVMAFENDEILKSALRCKICIFWTIMNDNITACEITLCRGADESENEICGAAVDVGAHF